VNTNSGVTGGGSSEAWYEKQHGAKMQNEMNYCVEFEVFTAVVMKSSSVFWDSTV
jgi:hypothetical protein